MADLTPAEKALAEMADSLDVAGCEHMILPDPGLLVACVECDLPRLIAAARPHIEAEALRKAGKAIREGGEAARDAGDGRPVYASELWRMWNASADGWLHSRADEIEQGASDGS